MSLANDAINQIKQLIVSGELSPGDRLPKETELAAQLGLSRSSLREAVRALTLVGVLDVRRGDGTYVTSLEPHLLFRGTTFVLELLQGRTILELLEIRRLLEPGATALAAARMDDSHLARLRDCLERIDTPSSEEDRVEADDEFHAIIVDAAEAPVLAALIKSLSSKTFRVRLWRGIVDEVAIEQTKQRHHAIYRALQARDPELARAAATVHIAEVEYWFRSRMVDNSVDDDVEASA